MTLKPGKLLKHCVKLETQFYRSRRDFLFVPVQDHWKSKKHSSKPKFFSTPGSGKTKITKHKNVGIEHIFVSANFSLTFMHFAHVHRHPEEIVAC